MKRALSNGGKKQTHFLSSLKDAYVFSVFKSRVPAPAKNLKKTRYMANKQKFLKIPYVRDGIVFSCYGGIGVFSKTENSIRETGLAAGGKPRFSAEGNILISRERLEENKVLKMG